MDEGISAEGAACARAPWPCVKPNKQREVRYEAGEMSRGLTMQDFVNHEKNFGLYPKINIEPLKGSKPFINQKLQLVRSVSAFAF